MSKSDEVAASFGYLTKAEVDELKRLASRFNRPECTIINIGAGAGTSGLALREAAPDARVVTVDISSGGALGGLRSERNVFKGTNLRLPEQILGDSAEVGRAWETPVDLVFVDGGHGEECIRADIEAWAPRATGIIAFHDYESWAWGAVKEVVDEVFCDNENFEKITHVDTLIAFRILK